MRSADDMKDSIMPGIVLVVLGSMIISILVVLACVESQAIILIYCGTGIGFLLILAGIIFLFLALIRSATDDTELTITTSDVENIVRQLGKNYDVLRRQATQGFILAGTFMALGILVILGGSVGYIFGFAKPINSLTTIAGIIIEAISGVGLYLFKETFKRLNATSDQLHEMWKILAAFNKAETLSDEKKSDVIIALINKLVEVSAPSVRG